MNQPQRRRPVASKAAPKRGPRARRKKAPPNSRRIRLLLVDDHPVVREGLRSFLSACPELQIVGEAGSGEEALLLAARHRPDLVLMDINLPGIDGLETTRRLREATPSAQVMILSVHDRREYVTQAARCGARGYMLKDTAPDELVGGIIAVHRGQAVFSPQLTSALLPATSSDKTVQLTAREREVLVLIAKGERGKDIAVLLGVSPSTVKTLRERLMRKLGRHSIAKLTQYAMAQGLVERSDRLLRGT